jgi:PPK2 family polyphosphate:nucleotide phosphotransferase
VSIGTPEEPSINPAEVPVIKDRESFIKPYVVHDGSDFRLKKHDAADTGRMKKKAAAALLAAGIPKLVDLQQRLYAQDRWGLLLVFQAMDAAGKDGAIKHVMSGINPQGCQVFSFKSPSAEDLDHDFLWRTSKSLPERGRIGIFNRSYYEEVLVVRVHPEFLAKQKLPPELVTKKIWKQRYDDINAFEHYLSRNGYIIRKFFLNVSHGEQRRRFLERLTLQEKNWKFSMADAKEREYWNDYMSAYDDMIRHTATEHAPWIVVPADNKAFARILIGAAVVSALESLQLDFPKVDAAKKRELEGARVVLESEKGADKDNGNRAGRKKAAKARGKGTGA